MEVVVSALRNEGENFGRDEAGGSSWWIMLTIKNLQLKNYVNNQEFEVDANEDAVEV
jgi:hypothetical protein